MLDSVPPHKLSLHLQGTDLRNFGTAGVSLLTTLYEGVRLKLGKHRPTKVISPEYLNFSPIERKFMGDHKKYISVGGKFVPML